MFSFYRIEIETKNKAIYEDKRKKMKWKLDVWNTEILQGN